MDVFSVNLFPVAKVEEWKAFCQSAADGEKAADHRAFLKRMGVTREHIFHQATPMGSVMVLVWEGVGQEQANQGMAEMFTNPASDYEQWLRDYVVKELHGVDPAGPPPPPIESIATIEP